MVLGLLLTSSAAFAQTYPLGTDLDTGGGTTGRLEVQPSLLIRDEPPVAAQPSVDSGIQTLPVTGGDIVGLALIGLGSGVIGAVLVGRSRRRLSTP